MTTLQPQENWVDHKKEAIIYMNDYVRLERPHQFSQFCSRLRQLLERRKCPARLGQIKPAKFKRVILDTSRREPSVKDTITPCTRDMKTLHTALLQMLFKRQQPLLHPPKSK